MKNLSLNSALIMIDVQKGFDFAFWGPRNNPEAEANMLRLLTAFRKTGRTVIHIQHMSTSKDSPLFPGQPGNDFKEIVRPLNGELIIQKNVNSSFIGTTLETELEKRGIKTLVIAGISTNHCVSTTARMSGNMGYDTYISSDATHAFDFKGLDGKLFPAQLMHEVGLAEIHLEFGQVLSTNRLLELIKV